MQGQNFNEDTTDDEINSDSDLDLDPIPQLPVARFQHVAENFDRSFKSLNIDNSGGEMFKNTSLEQVRKGAQR